MLLGAVGSSLWTRGLSAGSLITGRFLQLLRCRSSGVPWAGDLRPLVLEGPEGFPRSGSSSDPEAEEQGLRTQQSTRPHLLGVILTDAGVGDVVSGDRLHVFSGGTQARASAGETPGPTVYFRGHGEVAGWEPVPEPPTTRLSWNWREPAGLLGQPPLLPPSSPLPGLTVNTETWPFGSEPFQIWEVPWATWEWEAGGGAGAGFSHLCRWFQAPDPAL